MSAPLLLAIETSLTTGGIALGRGRAAIEIALAPPVRHAEAVLPAIDFALAALALGRGDIEGVAVGGGPGSFTGLRIAAATAKGLAHALAVPLYAASGLLVQAAAHRGGGRPVCSMFDARRGEVYAACYDFAADGSITTTSAPEAADALDVFGRLRGHEPIVVGEGAERNRDRLEAAGARLRTSAAARAGGLPEAPSAAVLLELVASDPARYLVERPTEWEPDYVRASSAERGLNV